MISICILNYDDIKMTEKAVMSVLRQNVLKFISYEVLIMDNCSKQTALEDCIVLTKNLRDKGYHVNWVALDNAYKFISGLNGAFKHALYDWVIFMENDIVMKEGCLWSLIINRNENDIISPVMYQPDGTIERFGSRWIWPGYGINEKKWRDRTELMTPSCFLMNKSIFKSIGTFDIKFAPAYYEDVDYSIRARNLGYHLKVIKNAQAFHRHNSTFKRFYKKKEISEICRINRRKLIKKHYFGLDRLLRLIAVEILDFTHGLFPSGNGRIGNRNN